jgi:hypothetical protein
MWSRKLFLFAFMAWAISGCELLEEETADDNNDIQNIPEEQLFVRHAFPYLDYPPDYLMAAELSERTFATAYWNENELSFINDSYGFFDLVEVTGINITGAGNYLILNQPLGVISRPSGSNYTLLYTTDVVPSYYTAGGPPYALPLVQGGSGYDLSVFDNVPTPVAPQGGYLRVTDFNQRYISGELFFVAWRFDNVLNREVPETVYIQFSGVPFIN